MAPKKGAKRVAKTRPALDFGDIRVEAVNDRRTMAEYRRTRGERDAEQTQVDKIVSAAYDEWIAAGKPTAWTDQPGTFLSVPQAQAETLRWRVVKAGQHYGLKIRFGDQKDADGYAEVVFTATERPVAADGTTEDDGEEAQDGDELTLDELGEGETEQ